jgi:hypothetical protein
MCDAVDEIILALEKDAAIGDTSNILAAKGTSWEDAVLYSSYSRKDRTPLCRGGDAQLLGIL